MFFMALGYHRITVYVIHGHRPHPARCSDRERASAAHLNTAHRTQTIQAALLQGSVAVATPLWRGTAATNVGFRAYLDLPGARGCPVRCGTSAAVRVVACQAAMRVATSSVGAVGCSSCRLAALSLARSRWPLP